jgi:hypothetical protein
VNHRRWIARLAYEDAVRHRAALMATNDESRGSALRSGIIVLRATLVHAIEHMRLDADFSPLALRCANDGEHGFMIRRSEPPQLTLNVHPLAGGIGCRYHAPAWNEHAELDQRYVITWAGQRPSPAARPGPSLTAGALSALLLQPFRRSIGHHLAEIVTCPS